MVPALRVVGAEVPCVIESKAEYLDSNGLRQLCARVQRQADSVQFVEQSIPSRNERCCLRNLDNHAITVGSPANFADLKMKVAIVRLDVNYPEIALQG